MSEPPKGGGGGATDFKSPKPPPRRIKAPEPARQVHFEHEGGGGKTGHKNAQQGTFKESEQPTVFPQLGVAPGSNGQVQWHTSANPTLSLRQAQGLGAGITPAGIPSAGAGPFQPQAFTAAGAGAGTFPPFASHAGAPFLLHQQQQQNHHHNHHHQQYCCAASPPTSVAGVSFAPPSISPATTPGITYIGLHQQPHSSSMAADYQNAAPPPAGVHFQPPVPDTTFGPIPHVYVPRFDGGLVPAVQVGAPPVQFVQLPPAAPATTTVVLPKTVYVNGYTYYASLPGPAMAVPSLIPYFIPYLIHPIHQPAIAQPVQSGYVVQQQPYVVHQPVGQPPAVVVTAPPALAPQLQPQHVAGVPAVGLGGGVATMSGGIPVYAGNAQAHFHAAPGHHVPEVTGLGRTAGEEQLRQVKFAYANRLFEPQDFKPADDDPSRFYFVREVDGNWTQRNRFTIDSMGDCRWYVTDEGWFYAVRLPD